MGKRIVKIIAVGLILAGAGASGWLEYQRRVLVDEKQTLQSQLADSREKVSLLQQRYKEQKALEANLLRTKLSLEGRIGALQSDLERLEQENQNLQANRRHVSAKLQAEIEALTAQVQDLSQRSAGLEAELRQEKQKYSQAVADYDNRIASLNSDIEKLDANLKRTGFRLDRCTDHNTRLAEIAEELLYQYENKGVLTSLLENEPFTQLEKVELENLVQEYTEKINQEKIKR